jgi:hypothetical protein
LPLGTGLWLAGASEWLPGTIQRHRRRGRHRLGGLGLGRCGGRRRFAWGPSRPRARRGERCGGRGTPRGIRHGAGRGRWRGTRRLRGGSGCQRERPPHAEQSQHEQGGPGRLDAVRRARVHRVRRRTCRAALNTSTQRFRRVLRFLPPLWGEGQETPPLGPSPASVPCFSGLPSGAFRPSSPSLRVEGSRVRIAFDGSRPPRRSTS